VSEAQTIASEALAETPAPELTESEAQFIVDARAGKGKGQKPTKYNILKLHPATSPGSPALWEVVATDVEAQGAAAAIRKTVSASEETHTFVAPPSRSWQPVTVSVETKTQLILS
jgi:hypothetical protein